MINKCNEKGKCLLCTNLLEHGHLDLKPVRLDIDTSLPVVLYCRRKESDTLFEDDGCIKNDVKIV